MRTDTRPCVAVNVEKQCILRCPYEAIGDHVRMLCKEQRWYNRTGGEPFDVVAAHPVKEGDAVVDGRGERLIVLGDAPGGACFARERFAPGRIDETHYRTWLGR